jgi:TolB-like protein/class 3 adenylate cyclase/Tfp pilus assembly protein PilF
VAEQYVSTADERDLPLEIAHLLLIDAVGYSKLLVNEQIDLLQKLNQTVRATECFRVAEAEGKLIRVPTGDGMALLFFRSPEEPVRCALEIGKALRDHPHIQLRMGIHSGPVNRVTDVNDKTNIAGSGINVAQRVLDCGDAGHILLSAHIAEDLTQYRHWQRYLHDLGECEVKHGLRLHLFNLYKDNLGNPKVPEKLKRRRWKQQWPPIRPVPSPPSPKFLLAVALVVSVAALAASVGIYLHRESKNIAQLPVKTGAAASVPEKSIAVLPFESLSDEKENAYFTEGVQDEILNNLAKVGGLKVISRTSVMQYKAGTQRNLREIARELGVAHVLEGSVQRAGDRVRVSAQLIDARSDTHLWAERYDRDLADVFAMESELAKTIVAQLKLRLSADEKAAIEKQPTADLAAYDSYLRGRYLLNRRTIDSIQSARALFEQAVARDPKFALGHAGIAESYILLGKIGAITPAEASRQAWSEVSLALAIDDKLAAGYVSRAILLAEFEWNWPAAEADYRKALELDPNNAGGHYWYARGLGEFGRIEDALREVSDAQKLDPLSAAVRATKAKILVVAQRYDDAIKQSSAAIDLEPGFASAFSVLAQAYLFNKQPAEGIEAAKKYVDLSAGSGWAKLELAFAYAIAGNRSEAERIVRETTASGDQFSPYDMATIYAAWHETDSALRWLKQAVEQRSVDVVWIRVDPRLDNIRSDPRFQEIVKSMMPG